MFKRWCKDQGFANNSDLSHVLMDGGVLSVPFDKLNDFYEKCVEVYNSGEKIFVVEQKTENYNFFMDLDYKDDEEMSFEQIKSVCKVICDKVSKFGGKDALISVAEPKPIDTLIKTGIHINWPGFVVNRSSALGIRDHVINTLNLAYGSRDWKDIVDISVYGNNSRNTKGSGFRMPWSHKKGKHEACAGQGCELCNNTGKETQSEYLPIFIYKHGPSSTLQKTEQKPSVDILHMATLRTQSMEPVIIEGTHKEATFTTLQTKNEFKDQEALLLVEAFVRKNVEGQTTASITKMFKYNKQFLVSTNSKYCENKKCNHNSNHVWFHIVGDTIAQKCFSTTNVLRQYGFCKDFSGRRHQLSKKITDILYEDGKVETYTPKKKVVVEPEQNLLEKFIKKYIVKKETFVIESLKREGVKKYTVTTREICDTCKETISFSILKSHIQQVCKCKCRAHNLTDKIVSTL
ncbi:hypothetical protein BpV1_064 [Bathycoccus sp. RCC1105 virus BpV1]|uniref:hypothetical protein n=1 Tax=Bathycoccus sp. RCC1105 virus BpV1 TaxID=880159 RepID=UPI0001EF43C2|nr:hypothetical protein BpV1_064 [Bathycoccus sp. RCC1105 virus BpV1]ADQ91691.1 hypothetical protein BpV1_064 [Bathycoccus sp. RCC1105 virus BpV1]